MLLVTSISIPLLFSVHLSISYGFLRGLSIFGKTESPHLLWQAVLLQEGAVHMLLQILSLEATSSVPVAKLDWFVCSFRVVALLCDTAVSFSPAASMDRWVGSFHLNCFSHM